MWNTYTFTYLRSNKKLCNQNFRKIDYWSQEKKSFCQKWDSNPRPHSRTRILMPLLSAGKVNLESGALDRSAILTYVLYFPFKHQQ